MFKESYNNSLICYLSFICIYMYITFTSTFCVKSVQGSFSAQYNAEFLFFLFFTL